MRLHFAGTYHVDESFTIFILSNANTTKQDRLSIFEKNIFPPFTTYTYFSIFSQRNE